MLFLIYDEIEFVRDERHLPLVVLDVVVLDFLEQLLHARLAEELDERLVFWITFVCSEQKHSSVLLIAFGYKFLSFIQQAGNELFLAIVESFDIRFEFIELLVVAPWDRT